MKTLALATAISMILLLPAVAQDSKQSTGIRKQGTEATVTGVDANALQREVAIFTEAIKKQPNNDRFYNGRAISYFKMRQFKEAVVDNEKAIALNPKNGSYLELNGDLYGSKKDYQTAFKFYAQALDVGPKSAALFLKQGRAASIMRDQKSGYKAGKSALELAPNDAQVLSFLGGCEQSLGMLQDSLTHLNRAILLSPNDGDSFMIRANTYSKLGDTEKANKDRQTARRLGSTL